MDLSTFLLVGILLGGLLFIIPTIFMVFISSVYWFAVLLWSTKLLNVFIPMSHPWLTSLDINFSYNLDPLSQLFSFLISTIGILTLIYSYIYFQNARQNRKKLLGLIQIFAIAMLGIVVADDLVFLYLCWETTTLLSYLLIQFNTASKPANNAALNSIVVSVIGGLLMLIGFIQLYSIADTWSISEIIQITQNNTISLYYPFIFLLLGAITKSAQFPFHFWLTGAMEAPTPVSAYLHSATMVNAGIYLLARFHPAFIDLDYWYYCLSFFGITTMLISSIMSIFQDDLKALLAYTTIFALGSMVYLLGSSEWIAIEAFTIFLLFHGIYKAGAFMLVGTIDKEYQTRSISKLRGIGKDNKNVLLNSMIIFSSMAGLPPIFGFTLKQMIYEAKIASESVSYVMISLSILSSILIATASFKPLWAFIEGNVTTYSKAKLKFGYSTVYVIAALIITLSILDNRLVSFTYESVNTILSNNGDVLVNVISINTFVISFLSVCTGIVFYYAFRKYLNTNPKIFKNFSAQLVFEKIISIILLCAHICTKCTQQQSVTTQIRILFFTLVLCMTSVIIGYNLYSLDIVAAIVHTNIVEAIICIITFAVACSLVASPIFFNNLISLSILALTTSSFYIYQGAPDLSITQMLADILTIIILVIALKNNPSSALESNKRIRVYDGTISVLIGLSITLLLYSVSGIEFNPEIQEYFAKNSLEFAYGRNIVNVILVDFRALDTLGEILVIVGSVIGVSMLYKKVKG